MQSGIEAFLNQYSEYCMARFTLFLTDIFLSRQTKSR